MIYLQTAMGTTDGGRAVHASLAFQTAVGVVGAAVYLWIVEEVVVGFMYDV